MMEIILLHSLCFYLASNNHINNYYESFSTRFQNHDYQPGNC